MAAAYDTYDYPSYWIGREYEHESEIVAIKSLLLNIPKIDTTLEIGTGFARLTPSYFFRSRKIILSDPSAKLLKIAREKYSKYKKVKIVQSSLENLDETVGKNAADLIVMVRVIHHIHDLETAFSQVERLLKDRGFLILEFANKSHLKATLREFIKGNFTFPLDIFPKEVSTSRRRKKTLPFINYHPDVVKHLLEQHHMEVVKTLSVSNIRSPFLKRLLPLNTLISLERALQGPLAYISFGPSLFILAQKRD